MARELFLKKHGDYQRVYREGRKGSAALMGWFVAARGEEANGGGENKSKGEGEVESNGKSEGAGEREISSKAKSGAGDGRAADDGTKKNSASGAVGVRVGLTVPRTLGKAVDRNRMKRRMREAVRKQPEELLAGERDVVLHPRRTVLTCEFERLEREVGKVLREVAKEGAGEKPRPRVDGEKTKARTKPGARSKRGAAVREKVGARAKASG